MRGLDWTIDDPTASEVSVTVSGRFSEYAQLDELFSALPDAARLRLDLGAVERINSIGARRWIEFVDRCRDRFPDVKLERCSVVFVSQVNTVAGFGTCREVVSVFAPYVCEKCGHERELLVDVADKTLVALPGTTCPNDGSPMVFDDLEEIYFGFLRRP